MIELLDDATAARATIATMLPMQKVQYISALFHRFTVIHPFNSGNGRVGRALLTLVLYDCGLLSPPEELFGYVARRRHHYLNALHSADAGDMTPLINFFYRGVIDTYVQRLIHVFSVPVRNNRYRSHLSPLVRRFFSRVHRARLSDDTFLARIDDLQAAVDAFGIWVHSDDGE